MELTHRKCLKLSSLDKVKFKFKKKKNHRVLLIFLPHNFLKEIPSKGVGFTFLRGDLFFGVSSNLVPNNFLISKYCGLEVAQVSCWYFYNRKPPMLRN